MFLSWWHGLVQAANSNTKSKKRTNRQRLPRKLRYAARVEQLEDRVVPSTVNMFLNTALSGATTQTLAVGRGTVVPVYVDVGNLVGGAGGIQNATVYLKYDPSELYIDTRPSTVTPAFTNPDIKV